jgi:hypothetical protein
MMDVSRMTDLSPYFAIKPFASAHAKTSFKFSVGTLISELELHAANTATERKSMIFFMVTE